MREFRRHLAPWSIAFDVLVMTESAVCPGASP
jgi:hypothetical protein